MKIIQTVVFCFLFLLTACCTVPPIRPSTALPDDYSFAKTYLTWLIQETMAEQKR
ncbi:hypothetical protein [Methylocucumis oryzae]|uniref:hypothetical protein n=1 Tax=Methylocucumis oryzae TaxID=1632867 RepID=UPI001EF9F29E|nr:hypothetical protein [Methylocucumis oryzae]